MGAVRHSKIMGNTEAAMGALIQFQKPKRGWRWHVLFFVLTLLPWVLLLWLVWPTR
jgi:hypothetical protein